MFPPSPDMFIDSQDVNYTPHTYKLLNNGSDHSHYRRSQINWSEDEFNNLLQQHMNIYENTLTK